MSTYDGLILTVGMTHEPVIFSIRQASARKVAFICTPHSEKTLDAVVSDTGLLPSAWRKYVVADEPQQIGKLCLEFYSAFRWLTEECGIGRDKIVADPTAGRKWMSSGATIIAAFLGLTMHYVDARFDGKPDPATMKVVELGNAYDQTGFVEAEKGRVLFNQFEFAIAAEIFERIKPSVSAQADLYSGLACLARSLDKWNRFEHYERSLTVEFDSAWLMLRRHLESVSDPRPPFSEFVDQVKGLAEAIEELHTGPRPASGFMVDVFANAKRHIAQKRYDDACGRLYRTLESLAQYFLHKDFSIDAANGTYDQLSEDQRVAIQQALGGLPSQIDLDRGFRMLKALSHGVGEAVIVGSGKKQTNKFSGLLQDRNSSILAHGFKPIGKDRAEDFSNRIGSLLQEVLGDDFQQWSGRLQVPLLPPLLG
jgi:CRISPR-associated protein (TIGR02710 family)